MDKTTASKWQRARYRLAVRLAQRADLFDRLVRSDLYLRQPDRAWEDMEYRICGRLTKVLKRLPAHVRIAFRAACVRQVLRPELVTWALEQSR